MWDIQNYWKEFTFSTLKVKSLLEISNENKNQNPDFSKYNLNTMYKGVYYQVQTSHLFHNILHLDTTRYTLIIQVKKRTRFFKWIS